MKALTFRHPVRNADEVAADIKAKIADGVLSVGDVLLPMVKLATEYGVSVRQVRLAMRNLAAEGFVRSFPHVGARIIGRRRCDGGKKVLFLSVDDGDCVSLSMVQAALQRRLVRMGVEYHPLTFARQPDGKLDCSDLVGMLDRGFDLALCYMDSRQIARVLKANGVPFVVAGFVPDRFEDAVDSFCSWDEGPAMTALIGDCVRCGVRSVAFVGEGKMNGCRWIPEFVKAGMRIRQYMTPARSGRDNNVCNGERGGYEQTCRLLKFGKLPDLIHFTDDFVARGGMIALYEAGIRIPSDVKVSTFSLKGFRFFSSVSLARVELDNIRIGSELARYVEQFLSGQQTVRPFVPLDYVPAKW